MNAQLSIQPYKIKHLTQVISKTHKPNYVTAVAYVSTVKQCSLFWCHIGILLSLHSYNNTCASKRRLKRLSGKHKCYHKFPNLCVSSETFGSLCVMFPFCCVFHIKPAHINWRELVWISFLCLKIATLSKQSHPFYVRRARVTTYSQWH